MEEGVEWGSPCLQPFQWTHAEFTGSLSKLSASNHVPDSDKAFQLHPLLAACLVAILALKRRREAEPVPKGLQKEIWAVLQTTQRVTGWLLLGCSWFPVTANTQ